MKDATAHISENSDLNAEIDRLRADLRQIRADFTDFAGDAVSTARTGATQARDAVGRKVSSAAAQGREALESVEDQIGLHPIMSIATALTVGLVVGMALSRKG